jgi:hypothetical protein
VASVGHSCPCMTALHINNTSLEPLINSTSDQRPKNMFCSSTTWSWILVLSVFYSPVVSQSIIKTLPGFTGELPFKLETGSVHLINVGSVWSIYIYISHVYHMVFFFFFFFYNDNDIILFVYLINEGILAWGSWMRCSYFITSSSLRGRAGPI